VWESMVLVTRAVFWQNEEKSARGWGEAQEWGACLACGRPWVPSPAL
jgi:hypothetical protein